MKTTMQPRVDHLHSSRPTGALPWWRRIWSFLPAVGLGRAPRNLRLCESVSLGEKRVVAVVQYETQRFLIGGSAHSVTLLARLGETPEFSELLAEWCERQR